MSEGLNKKRDREQHTGPTHLLAVQRSCEGSDVFFSTRPIDDITLADARVLANSTPSSRSELTDQIKAKLGIRLDDEGEEFDQEIWTNLNEKVVAKFTNDHHCIVTEMSYDE